MMGRYHALFSRHLQVVGSTGRTLTAVCPFHAETDGSLSVDTERGLYFCFGCGAKGNYAGFTKALKVAELSPPPPDVATTAHRLRRLADEIDHGPPASLDPPAYVWMSPESVVLWRQRGVTPDTCEDLMLGYDPMVGALTIPVGDWIVRRMLGKDARPKYRYPKGYPRSSVFIGQDWVLPNHETTVLVEGPIDAICLWQAVSGLRSAVYALGGSALAEGQLDALDRAGRPVVLCLDGDAPGQKATAEIMAKLREAKVPTLAPIRLPDGKDPGDLDSDYLRAAVLKAVTRKAR